MGDSVNIKVDKPKYKVCFATVEYPPDIGGVSKSARRIVHFLNRSGFEMHVFSPIYRNIGNNTVLLEENIEGIKVYRVKCLGRHTTEKNFIEAIEQIDKKENFDVFHGFFLYMAYPCIQAAVKGKRPVIASFRGIDAIWMEQPGYAEMALEILKEASWITSVSKESLKCANEIVQITNKSSFIFNSISCELPKWKLTSDNKNVVGTVSTFREKKNLPLLINAYASMQKTNRKNLLLVGDFIENKAIDLNRKANFLKLAQYYNVQDEVVITGYIHNSRIHEYLSAMNVFVLSSKHEGLPNAIMEAVNMGMPIVSTAVDGIKDILTDGVDALLVPADDEISMKIALESVISNDRLALQLSGNALKLSKALSPESEEKAWVDLYDSLLN